MDLVITILGWIALGVISAYLLAINTLLILM